MGACSVITVGGLVGGAFVLVAVLAAMAVKTALLSRFGK